MDKMYTGWLILPEGDEGKQITVECEITLKEKDQEGAYQCEVSDLGMEKLDKYWGSAYWGLEKVG